MYDTEIRDVDIAGETNWHWVKADTGAFDGPMNDWLENHSQKYFEHVKKFDTVVTGGTSCGMYARFYSKMFKHVYAFEPDPLSFHCMVNNCQFDNVYKLNAAMGHIHGLVGIHRAPPGGHEMNIGMHQITNTNEFKIPMMTIDSLNLDTCDLIQIDVEGFEQYVIAGARQTIDKYKPVIIAERFSSMECQNFMKEYSYELVNISSLDSIYIHTGVINKPVDYFIYNTP